MTEATVLNVPITARPAIHQLECATNAIVATQYKMMELAVVTWAIT